MIFKNIYYDSWKNKMHLWELEDDGKTSYKIFDHEIEYYTLDKTGKSPIKSIFGEPVVRHVAKNKNDLKELKQSGERLFESDLDETVKFLHKRYKGIEHKINISDYKIFNIDIENEFPESPTINLIGIENYNTGETVQFGLKEYTGENKEVKYITCESESVLLTRFCKYIKYMKVEYFCGWNIYEFDIPKIQERIDALNLKCSLSPINRIKRNNDGTIDIAGIDILDNMVLYKKFTYKNQPSFSLDYIGNLECGEGKVSYEGSILDFWKTDWNKFCDYNYQDMKLVTKIDAKKKFIPLAIVMGTDSRIPFSKVVSPIAVIEGDLIEEMHSDNVVLEDITHNIHYEKTRSIIGGHVETYPGFYNYCINIDCTSEYPHNIMMFNISKETKVLNPTEQEIPNLIKSHIPGVYYKKDKEGYLPRIVKKSFGKRKTYKKLMFQKRKEGDDVSAEYYDSQQLIQKIKINAAFGATSNPYFHFYDFDNASQITAAGRDAIQYVGNRIDDYFIRHFYKDVKNYYPESTLNETSMKKYKTLKCLIDTDSVHFILDTIFNTLNNNMSYLEFCLDFEKRILEPFLTKIMDEYADRYNTKNMLHFKREKIILKEYVQAKKKYANFSIANEEDIYDYPKLSITGLETRKSDLCKFSRESIMKLIEMMFEGDCPDHKNMQEFIRAANKQFKNLAINEVASPKSVTDYDKYNVEIDKIPFNNFLPHTPIHNRASIIYNKVIKDHNLPYVEIKNGSKLKYVYVHENNAYKTDVIGFVGNWPKEFDNFFKIDFKKQFEKQYLNIADRMFETLGFGPVVLKPSKMSKLIEE